MDCFESDSETWLTFHTLEKLMNSFSAVRYDKFSRDVGDIRQLLRKYPEIYNRLQVLKPNHDTMLRGTCLDLKQCDGRNLARWFSVFLAYWDEYQQDLVGITGLEYISYTSYMVVMHSMFELRNCRDSNGNFKYPEILYAIVGQLYFRILDTIGRSAELSAKYAAQVSRLKAAAEQPQ